MAVYVDDMRAPFGRMVMCHMIADCHAELVAMADAIGVQRRWIQKQGDPGEHFDISLGMRDKAVRLGAIEISQRELGRRVMDRYKAKGQATAETKDR